MTLEEFQEQYNEAPIEPIEFAYGAVDVTDCPELATAGQAYIDASHTLHNTLEKFGVEVG